MLGNIVLHSYAKNKILTSRKVHLYCDFIITSYTYVVLWS